MRFSSHRSPFQQNQFVLEGTHRHNHKESLQNESYLCVSPAWTGRAHAVITHQKVLGCLHLTGLQTPMRCYLRSLTRSQHPRQQIPPLKCSCLIKGRSQFLL